jgi:hypothetical protein
MPYVCYMVEQYPDAEAPGIWRLPGDERGLLTWDDLKPGAMWWDDGELCVKLPSGCDFNLDRGRLLNAAKTGRAYPAWTRTGDPPKVTATPSINHVGRWHGWLRDGVLTEA